MKSYFKCEIKSASRWQQVTVNKWVITTEPNHLNDWFIQEQNSCCSESHIEIIFVGEIEQKHSILCLNVSVLILNSSLLNFCIKSISHL